MKKPQVDETSLPKSAPYLRLKNSKRTSKCQVFSFTVPKKPKNCTELYPKTFEKNENEDFEPSHSATKCKMEDPIGFLNIFVAKHQKH